ncbi:hypothetical protein CNR22_00140 [Sphingobacteriaceae bacterium]|nr:hypothetical protein CNR22_00140 [Sphingobacteriaceae bacterium]
MLHVFWFALAILAGCIAYQDFKDRLISLWLIVSFCLINTTQYLMVFSLKELLNNSLFCIIYFLFLYGALHVYYFLKTKKIQTIIDEKIGWADILLVFIIGACIDSVLVVVFFTVSFLMALLLHLFILRSSRPIPFAAVLVINYLLYLVVYGAAIKSSWQVFEF